MASFPLLVFDLDGTLVDALPDLAAALNRLLDARGLQPLTPAEVRPMIGDGTRKLVDATLARLRDDDWRFAVCTNKSTAATKALLQALGLAHWFAALGCGDTFAARKPDPAHLGGTIALAGGARERSIMVGDHANDIAAGRAFGLPTVFAAWGYGDPTMAAGASAVAERFSDLAELAPRLLG